MLYLAIPGAIPGEGHFPIIGILVRLTKLACGGVLAVAFIVSWHRLFLIGEPATHRKLFPPIDRRDWRFVRYLVPGLPVDPVACRIKPAVHPSKSRITV